MVDSAVDDKELFISDAEQGWAEEQTPGGKLLFKTTNRTFAPPLYGVLIAEKETEWMEHIEAVSWSLFTQYGQVALRSTHKGRIQVIRDMLEALEHIKYFYDNLTPTGIIYTPYGLTLKCKSDEAYKAVEKSENKS